MFDCKSDKYFVPYEHVHKLYRAGMACTAVDAAVAERLIAEGVISEVPEIIIPKSARKGLWLEASAFSAAVLGVGACFAGLWWLAVPALGAGYMLYARKSRGGAEEMLQEYDSNKTVYERVAEAGGIMYRFDRESDAAPFLRK